MKRNTKICALCGKIFIVPGACSDYLYKRGSLYYCSYNHWRIEEKRENSNKKIRRPTK